MAEHAQNQTVFVTLEAETCISCGTAFGISSNLKRELLRSHKTFHCPNGHGQHYIDQTEEERLRKDLDLANKRTEWAKTDAKNAENRRRAAVGQLTKIKNRVKNGVCPCCNRTFKNLARHMGTKHPEFVVTD